MSCSARPRMPLMFVDVAGAPPAETAPRHTCAIPNPDIATTIVFGVAGAQATSQYPWRERRGMNRGRGRRGAGSSTSRIFPSVVPAYMRFVLTSSIAETLVGKPGRSTFPGEPPSSVCPVEC